MDEATAVIYALLTLSNKDRIKYLFFYLATFLVALLNKCNSMRDW